MRKVWSTERVGLGWGRWGVLVVSALVVVALARAMIFVGGVRAADVSGRGSGAPARVTGVREADAACAGCHAAIFAKYVRSPMANGSGVAEEHFLPGAMRDAGSGMEYRVAMVDGRPTLEYEKAGDAAVKGERRLEYFLGSGRLGTTYLYSEGGYLLESPVAWYSRLQGYAMAPGLEGVRAMPAALPMDPGCMRCHMSDVQAADAGSRDHFSGLPFLHGGVTCEGCHGDASAHVRTAGKAAVLNPMKLDAATRDSVCASCHLEGDVSVAKAGRSVMAFKPGDRLNEFVTHFALQQGSTERSVSETEQLLVSRCKRASGDRMSCMSCHDAHGDPSPEERVAFYRGKCLACHSDAGFAREHFPATPDCTSCHMPKNGAMDTPHVAWTDHRLRQRPEVGPGTGLSLGGVAGESGSGAGPEVLKPVYTGPGRGAEAATPRDVALAYYKAMNKGHGELARGAWERLNAAAAATGSGAEDPEVLVALGYMNAMQGRLAEARTLLERALRLRPDDAEARSDEATLLARAGEVEAATTAERGAWVHNEDSEALGVNLATLQCAGGDRAAGEATLRTVLRFSPDSARARGAAARCGEPGHDAR